jgi:hypothetical protein
MKDLVNELVDASLNNEYIETFAKKNQMTIEKAKEIHRSAVLQATQRQIRVHNALGRFRIQGDITIDVEDVVDSDVSVIKVCFKEHNSFQMKIIKAKNITQTPLVEMCDRKGFIGSKEELFEFLRTIGWQNIAPIIPQKYHDNPTTEVLMEIIRYTLEA